MLKPRDFQLAVQAIVIPGMVSKNDRTQGVAIANVLLPHLEQLGLEKQNPDHYVFSTGFKPGPALKTSRDSGREWDHMRKRTGLEKTVTMYSLKLVGAEELSNAGIGEVDLMNHMRHHDLSQTTIYTRRNKLGGVRSVLDKAKAF